MSTSKILFALIIVFGALHSPLRAQKIDETYNARIKEYTTDTRFLPASVLNLVYDAKIPSPRKHFGDIIGAPGVMHHTTEIYAYYRKLSETSPYLKMQLVATSEEGRPIYAVIIGDKDAMNGLDHYKKQLELLADPRRADEQAADKIIADAKPVFYLNAGLHSPEMGSPEMLMELAYRLITSEDEAIRNIREHIIVVINPVSEPDGRDKQVDWYYRYSKARKEYDDGFMRTSPYWGRYVYHDNNRDGLQISQALTKAIFKLYYEWHPVVMLDLHESVPLIYMSTGTGPYNEAVDPITVGEWQVMANYDITTLASQGLPGAFTWAFYDGWWPGYGIWVANNHNSIGRFYETFGNAGANTYLRDLSKDKYAGDLVTNREWYRPDPATALVNWSARNNINYMEAGVLGSLSYTANNGKQLLLNFYQKGVNNIRKGREEKPKAFVIPGNQTDPAMAGYLVNQLRAQAIEVHLVKQGEHKGDYVVLLDQPYRNLAVTLLSKQNYPKEAKFPPYDDIAWTLGLLYGVDVKAEDSIQYAADDLARVTAEVRYAGSVTGDGSLYMLNYKAQQSVLPALYWLKTQNKNARISVWDTARTIAGSEDTLAAGSLLFKGVTPAQAKTMADKFGLDLKASATVDDIAKQHDVALPRIAIYHTWYSTQDEGWSRFTFEQRGIPFTSIDKDDLRNGSLRKRFDVILIPRVGGDASDFIQGIDKKFGPMPFTKTTDYPSHGIPDETNDMTGGPGFTGMEQLKQFVEEGGVLITLDNATTVVSVTGIAKELAPYQAEGLFHPGSVVQTKARKPNHPVFYGFPATFPIFRGNGPLFQVEKFNRDMILLQYGTKPLKDEEPYKGPILGMPDKQESKEMPDKANDKKEPPYVLSGMVRNEQSIIGHGTIFNVPSGAGRVIAFTFDPLHRYLNHHDAPLVWNVLINWDHLK